MKTQLALLLFQYWNRLRNGAPVPSRLSIEPSDIRDVLSYTFILQSSSSAGDMNFRLAGTSISNLFGRQFRQSPFRQLFHDRHHAVVSRLLRNCYQDHSLVLIGLEAVTRSGRMSNLEILLLPLQSETEGNHILGCIVPHKKAFWHGLEPVLSLDLQSIRVLDPDRELLFLANRPEILLAPSVSPTEMNLEPMGRKTGAQLLVIEGGKSTAPQ